MSEVIRRRRRTASWRRQGWVAGVLAGLLNAGAGAGQVIREPGVPSGPEQTITVAVGNSTVITSETALLRVLLTNPEVAEAMAISGYEVIIHGRSVGSTSLLLWNVEGEREAYTVVVTADPALVQQQLRSLFPEETITVTAAGGALVLSGEVSDERVEREAIAVAERAGLEVIDRLRIPAPDQVLLRVRLAEVTVNAMREVGARFLLEHQGVQAVIGSAAPEIRVVDGQVEGTLSDALNLFLFHPELNLSAFIRALESHGAFRSLAEPNLLALNGEEASFLAGGEFPFPVVQGGGAGNPAVSIDFREFGVRLEFVPTITEDGRIRLHVAPEVSTLDFSSGLQISGFRVPAVLARRAETEVELRDGQTLAIAGLLDNSLTENVDRVPVLGSIPILGALFRSTELRQRRTELVVLVTPHLVRPSEVVPPLPGGEPEEWQWIGPLRRRDGGGKP